MENINKTDGNGWTALHYAIDNEFETAVKKLITRRDVDVDIKNNDNRTAFQLASDWEDIPSDLFKLISERSTNETAREKESFFFSTSIVLIFKLILYKITTFCVAYNFKCSNTNVQSRLEVYLLHIEIASKHFLNQHRKLASAIKPDPQVEGEKTLSLLRN